MTTKQLCFFGAPGSKETNIRLLLGGGRSQHISVIYLSICLAFYLSGFLSIYIPISFYYLSIIYLCTYVSICLSIFRQVQAYLGNQVHWTLSEQHVWRLKQYNLLEAVPPPQSRPSSPNTAHRYQLEFLRLIIPSPITKPPKRNPA